MPADTVHFSGDPFLTMRYDPGYESILAHYDPGLATFTTIGAAIEDWGAYSLVPASAQDFVLEAVGGGAADGTTVSINAPAGKPHQKWIVVAKKAGFFGVKPAHEPSLALTAAQSGTKPGTAIVLEKDSGKPSQLWALTKHENGSYSLIPKHAPGLGLNHFGGKRSAGATIDLWTHQATDPHLQWFIRPLAGSGVEGAERGRSEDGGRYAEGPGPPQTKATEGTEAPKPQGVRCAFRCRPG